MKAIRFEEDIVQDKFTEFVKLKFDYYKEKYSKVIYAFEDFEIKDEPFNILTILGSSGSGKSSCLKSLGYEGFELKIDKNKAILQQFPDLTPEDVTSVFMGVGLSSVPLWFNRYANLSNGEKFRFEIAYRILNSKPGEVIFIDEFTSVVNRAVAKSMSVTLSKFARRHNLKIILASCHYDIVDWLNPDLVFDLNTTNNDGMPELVRIRYDKDGKNENGSDYLGIFDRLSDVFKVPSVDDVESSINKSGVEVINDPWNFTEHGWR